MIRCPFLRVNAEVLFSIAVNITVAMNIVVDIVDLGLLFVVAAVLPQFWWLIVSHFWVAFLSYPQLLSELLNCDCLFVYQLGSIGVSFDLQRQQRSFWLLLEMILCSNFFHHR